MGVGWGFLENGPGELPAKAPDSSTEDCPWDQNLFAELFSVEIPQSILDKTTKSTHLPFILLG